MIRSDIDEEDDADEWDGGRTGGVIPQGSRNNTLSLFAGKALKRFGETDKAKQIFMEEAAKCDPPLDKEELKSIWYSAVKFFRNKIKDQEGYVDPEDYNADFQNGCYKPGDYSDMGQAKALIQEYGDVLRYSDATENPYFCLKCLKIKGLRDLESDLYTCCTPILKILLTGLPSIKKDS